jgi:hypothetical protein
MNATKSLLLLFIVLAGGLLAGCDIFGGGTELDEDIVSFVEAENLPHAKTPKISFDDSDSEVKAFQVEFGPGCDCPSGCFYSKGYGLKFRDRIGWLEVREAFCLDESVRGQANFFDIRPGDSTLFDQDLRDRFKEKTAGDDYEYSVIYKLFLQRLARDRDVPSATLNALIDLLFEERFSNVAEALIQNPTVRSNESLLERLSNLPDWAGYRPVKEEARELLNHVSASIHRRST